jgi:hypothetical protein
MKSTGGFWNLLFLDLVLVFLLTILAVGQERHSLCSGFVVERHTLHNNYRPPPRQQEHKTGKTDRPSNDCLLYSLLPCGRHNGQVTPPPRSAIAKIMNWRVVSLADMSNWFRFAQEHSMVSASQEHATNDLLHGRRTPRFLTTSLPAWASFFHAYFDSSWLWPGTTANVHVVEWSFNDNDDGSILFP